MLPSVVAVVVVAVGLGVVVSRPSRVGGEVFVGNDDDDDDDAQ